MLLAPDNDACCRRKVLDEQRPKYHLARQVYRERSQLMQPLALQALAVPPGKHHFLSQYVMSAPYMNRENQEDGIQACLLPLFCPWMSQLLC